MSGRVSRQQSVPAAPMRNASMERFRTVRFGLGAPAAGGGDGAVRGLSPEPDPLPAVEEPPGVCTTLGEREWGGRWAAAGGGGSWIKTPAVCRLRQPLASDCLSTMVSSQQTYIAAGRRGALRHCLGVGLRRHDGRAVGLVAVLAGAVPGPVEAEIAVEEDPEAPPALVRPDACRAHVVLGLCARSEWELHQPGPTHPHRRACNVLMYLPPAPCRTRRGRT
jgi:hypothetical protein